MNFAKTIIRFNTLCPDWIISSKCAASAAVYDEYMGYWNSNKYKIEDEDCINIIDEKLNYLYDNDELTPCDLNAAFYAIFSYQHGLVDDCHELFQENSEIYGFYEVKCGKNKLRIFPIVKHKGTFGFNTFLYCYFNGVYIVSAASNKDISTHMGDISDSHAMFTHDMGHIQDMISEDGPNKENFRLYKRAYEYLVKNQHLYSKRFAKVFISLLFFNVHETSELINVDVIHIVINIKK